MTVRQRRNQRVSKCVQHPLNFADVRFLTTPRCPPPTLLLRLFYNSTPSMNKVQLGSSDLHVTPICLGTMTFGEQVAEADAHAILNRALQHGINFIDAAEMYSVPARAETFGATETILGHWFEKTPGARAQTVLATKVAGPSRGMPWIRNGSTDLTGADIIQACEDSLKRLKTDVIDLYQIHWPARHVPAFGITYLDRKSVV